MKDLEKRDSCVGNWLTL